VSLLSRGALTVNLQRRITRGRRTTARHPARVAARAAPPVSRGLKWSSILCGAYPQIVNESGCLAAHTPTEAAANNAIPAPMVAIRRRTVRLLAKPEELAGSVFKISDFSVTPSRYKPIAHAAARGHLTMPSPSPANIIVDGRRTVGPSPCYVSDPSSCSGGGPTSHRLGDAIAASSCMDLRSAMFALCSTGPRARVR
jgi:hypothetical protein